MNVWIWFASQSKTGEVADVVGVVVGAGAGGAVPVVLQSERKTSATSVRKEGWGARSPCRSDGEV